MLKFNKRFLMFGLQITFFILLVTGAYATYMQTVIEAYSNDKQQLISNKSNIPAGHSFKFGMFINSPNAGPVEDSINNKLNIIAWFSHWNQNLNSDKLAYACKYGYVPEITWESWVGMDSWTGNTPINNPYPMDQIASGKYDGLIRKQILFVNEICGNQTVIIRFDHEMDTAVGTQAYYPWQGNPTEYQAGWIHVVNLARSIDPNIKWLFSFNRGTTTARLYYPGSKYVDYVGLTLNDGPTESTQYSSFENFFSKNESILLSFHKPIIIGETTAMETSDPTYKGNWISGMFKYIKNDHNINALVWFNGTKTFKNYAYNTSQSSILAFKQGLSSLNTKGK